MADVLQATYADLKTVKTRSTCQLILELPIEALTDVVALLGAPVPGNEVWVAVARLRPEAVQSPPAMIEPPDGDKPPRPLSQVSAILCNIVAFRRFLHEQHGFDVIPTVDEAADWVREHCGVQSRREFDTDDAAASNFRSLRGEYTAWMECAA
jgi:hypothetical protein